MEKTVNYLALYEAIQKRLWVRVIIALWALICTYDTAVSQLVPEETAKNLPKTWRVAVMTGDLLPWWGWLLVFAVIVIVALVEHLVRVESRQSSTQEQAAASVALPPTPAAEETTTYLTAHDVIQYLADDSQWGSQKEAVNARLLAPLEFKERASEGKIPVYGISPETGRHELIPKTHWMSYGLDTARIYIAESESRTIPATFESSLNGLDSGYAVLKIVAADVYRVWPRSTEEGSLPILEAAKIAYQRTQGQYETHWLEAAARADGKTEEQILDRFAKHLGMTGAKLFGVRPLMDTAEEIPRAAVQSEQAEFRNGDLYDVDGQIPQYKSVCISRRELKKAIAELNADPLPSESISQQANSGKNTFSLYRNEKWIPLDEAAQIAYDELEGTSWRKQVDSCQKPEERLALMLNYVASNVPVHGCTPPLSRARKLIPQDEFTGRGVFVNGGKSFVRYDETNIAFDVLVVREEDLRDALIRMRLGE